MYASSPRSRSMIPVVHSGSSHMPAYPQSLICGLPYSFAAPVQLEWLYWLRTFCWLWQIDLKYLTRSYHIHLVLWCQWKFSREWNNTVITNTFWLKKEQDNCFRDHFKTATDLGTSQHSTDLSGICSRGYSIMPFDGSTPWAQSALYPIPMCGMK